MKITTGKMTSREMIIGMTIRVIMNSMRITVKKVMTQAEMERITILAKEQWW